VGMVWFVPETEADRAIALASESGFAAWRVGTVTSGARKVTMENVEN
jgi:phosphoribosylaminoimidazole (AIR) synthetase